MKLYGTTIEISKTRNGEYCSNFHDFSKYPTVETDKDAAYLIEVCLGLARRRNRSDCDNTEAVIYTMLACLMRESSKNRVYNLGYGVNWNFASVLDAAMYDTFNVCLNSYSNESFENAKKEIAIQEAKTFVVPTKTTRSKATAPTAESERDGESEKPDVDAITNAIKDCINFFTEFDFEPNFRFLNTMSRYCSDSTNKAKKYIHNYFALIDSPYVNDIDNKMKSPEFESIVNVLAEPKNATHKQVNKRFEIYYGAQGTGKTTLAVKRAEGRVVVCNNSMLPADLMQDFDFNDGKAAFNSSALHDAMVNGKTIVLDEINLLPFESLRFLQGIVDGKTSIIYKNEEIKIADGFKIIGTMNLFVNGMAYSLPAPLVDRCEAITEFKLTAKDLVSAIV